MCHIRLAIAETEKVPASRAFYDTFEKSMNVVIKARGKFYSYIQGQDYSVDLSKKGKVLGIEVHSDRDSWQVDPTLDIPEKAEPREIHIMEHRMEIEPQGFYTNQDKSVCCMRFTDEKVSYKYAIAHNLLFEVNVMDELSAIWILDILEDFGYKKEMKYRKGQSVS